MTETDTSILEKSQTEVQEQPLVTWGTKVEGNRTTGELDVDTSQTVLSAATNILDHTARDAEISTSFNLRGEHFEILNLRAWARTVSLTRRLHVEGVHPPTLEARLISGELMARLFKHYRLYPRRVAASADEGVTITYRNHIASKTLVLEVYNTTEIAALIDNAKSIECSEDLTGIDDPALDRLIGNYRTVESTATP